MKTLLVAGAGVLAAGLLYQTPPPEPDEESYGVGYSVGAETRAGLGRDGMGVDLDLVTRGFREGLMDATPMVPETEIRALLGAVHREMEARRVRRLLDDSPHFKRLHDENLRKSLAFHELFGKQEGVVTLPSGVQYKVLRAGSGRSPGPSDTVVANATVKLLDGTVIDDVQAAEFRVDQVTPGGQEALRLMGVGARWQVAVPPELAHGAAGRFPDIGPNESLVAIVDLLAIK